MVMNFSNSSLRAMISQLELESQDYLKLRKNQVKSMARLRATTISQTLLFPFIEETIQGIEAVYVKDQLSIDWLSSAMVSVQPDSEKILEVVSNVKETVGQKVSTGSLDELVTLLIAYLKEDFNSMRSLRQSIYYRSRSINAILNFINTQSAISLDTKFASSQSVKEFFEHLKGIYLKEGKGAKHTKNSYLNEFFSFLYDVAPQVVSLEEQSGVKSLDSKFTQNLSNFADLAQNNQSIDNALQDLVSLLPVENNSDMKLTQIQNNLADSQSSVPSGISLSAKKGEGFYLSYSSESKQISEINEMAESLLLHAMSNEGLPDIEINIQTEPTPTLSVKCGSGTTPEQLRALRIAISLEIPNGSR